MAKPKTYTARSSIAELNRAFYERYDPRFLFNKAFFYKLRILSRCQGHFCSF